MAAAVSLSERAIVTDIIAVSVVVVVVAWDAVERRAAC